MSRTLLAILPFFLLAGCLGYRLGPITNPELQTIAVAKVENLTDEPRLGIEADSLIRNRIVTDGSLRLVPRSRADGVLQARVIAYKNSSAGSRKLQSNDPDQEVYTTSIFRVTVEVEYAVKLSAADGKTKVKKRVAKGTAEYNDLLDLEIAKRDGMRQALHEAAKEIVRDITEVW